MGDGLRDIGFSDGSASAETSSSENDNILPDNFDFSQFEDVEYCACV